MWLSRLQIWLLSLLCWVAAMARFSSLAWELLNATVGIAGKKKKELKCWKLKTFFLFWKPFFYFFLWLYLWHMEISRLAVESELQLQAYTTARAIPDLSCICSLCCILWPCWILNPLSKARNKTHILMDTMSNS